MKESMETGEGIWRVDVVSRKGFFGVFFFK